MRLLDIVEQMSPGYHQNRMRVMVEDLGNVLRCHRTRMPHTYFNGVLLGDRLGYQGALIDRYAQTTFGEDAGVYTEILRGHVETLWTVLSPDTFPTMRDIAPLVGYLHRDFSLSPDEFSTDMQSPDMTFLRVLASIPPDVWEWGNGEFGRGEFDAYQNELALTPTLPFRTAWRQIRSTVTQYMDSYSGLLYSDSLECPEPFPVWIGRTCQISYQAYLYTLSVKLRALSELTREPHIAELSRVVSDYRKQFHVKVLPNVVEPDV